MTTATQSAPATNTVTLTVDQCKRMVSVWKSGHDEHYLGNKLSCLSFSSNGKQLIVAATDGHLLIEEVLTPDEFTFPEFSVMITADSMCAMGQWLKTAPKVKRNGQPIDVLFAIDANHIVVAGWGSSVSLKLLDGAFPDYMQAFADTSMPCTKGYDGENGKSGNVVDKDFALSLKLLSRLADCWDDAAVRFHPSRGMVLTPIDQRAHPGKRALIMCITISK